MVFPESKSRPRSPTSEASAIVPTEGGEAGEGGGAGAAADVWASPDAPQVTIQVEDTGYGIPAADLPFVFNRFYRVRSGKASEVEGNGLGLAIVKSTAQQHGGDVTVESEVGKGTCFTLTLPLVESNILQGQDKASAEIEILS